MENLNNKVKVLKSLKLVALAFIFNFALMQVVNAQVLDLQNKVSVVLEDGTQVTLFGKANTLSENFSNEYYYLPVQLRLSKRPDGVPEFLFLKYTTEEKADAGGVQGALMHFLMEWGLTSAQETEVQKKLELKLEDIGGDDVRHSSKKPKVMGAATLRSDTEESFRIISATLTDNNFTRKLVTSGRAPLIPGAKIAVASMLDKNGAQLLAATFEQNRSITDVSVDLRFSFDVLIPAVSGRITVDWTQVYNYFQKTERDYTHHDIDDGSLPSKNSLRDDIITDTEKDSIFSYLMESKVVNIELDNLKPEDPTAQLVVQSFMEYFLQSIGDKEFAKSTEPKPVEEADRYNPPQDLYEYHLDRTKIENRISKKKEVYNLKLRMPIRQEATLTANLGSWYDGVKDNEACVSSVNLNDPFFQHRDINLILDLEAEEIFGKEVNYVTVNVKKRRNKGNDFEDQVTMDRDYLKNKGVKASLTYARGEDTNPDSYEYKAQWSLRGGNIYPANPSWIKGDWEGVTLAPPVKPRTIEFEANLDELEELGIVRATLQLRYMKFGKEVESNIAMTISKKEPLIEETIFTDRNTQGYAYRLVLTHKDKGKMALGWDARINDDYVYATIPQELKDEDPDFLNKALKAGKELLKPESDGSIKEENKILNKFKNVLDIFIDD